MSRADTQRAQTGLVRACDVVYGATNVIMGSLATWQAIAGESGIGMMIALWGMLVVNVGWSKLTVSHDRVRSDFIRGIVCIPFGTYMYAAESHGMFAQFWLPAFMQSVAVCLSLGIGTRRLRAPFFIAHLYTAAVLIAGGFALDSIHDALGIWLGTMVLSIVAAQLGRSIVETAQQRDEARDQRGRSEATLGQLTEAIAELHREMERRAHLEAELAHAQKLESVGRLAAGIAHEINTPVQFVGDSLHFMRDCLCELLALARQSPEEAQEELDLPYLVDELPKAMERAEDGLGRVAKIVRSMKVFAHPDEDAQVPADLNRAIEATAVIAHNEYRYVADLVLDLEAELPLVPCYLGELNQAVLNMIVNAAHAIGDVVGKSGARGEIRLRTRHDGDSVLISIADTGGGIPDSVRSRIFDPFFTTKEVGKGTGQGLAIAHAVAEKHHGQVWFETELGRGTTFFLRLPLAQAHAAAA